MKKRVRKSVELISGENIKDILTELDQRIYEMSPLIRLNLMNDFDEPNSVATNGNVQDEIQNITGESQDQPNGSEMDDENDESEGHLRHVLIVEK